MVLFKLFDVIDVRMADILDILLVSIILYYVFLLFRGTRAVQMIVGGLLLIVAWLIAQWWELRSITWLLSNLTGIGIVALVILFQPEIRSALTRIGQMISRADLRQLFFHSSGLDEVTESITSAVQDLAKNRVGALIVLEKRVGLRNYEETGEILNARISSRLLRALFFPNSALHDGAVLLNSQRIVAAGCILPMPTGNAEGDAGYGMRHRAAKALAAECDAMVIVVSEETGGISIAYRNSLRRKLSIKELEAEIKRHWAELYHEETATAEKIQVDE
ncbi:MULTISPECIES: diadenylate cyclase CdaA [Fibrobacter]|uniref:diadenylate cyclase CdaA n=1 Tax=Fibrobacter TaxID=832 RepID=UPI001564004D|nr:MULTISPECIES: diadenylate cyclase CdaA [Fibrobacter]MBR4784297.1 diadenylate cyclase CdaA [Fibrobacter sp.]